MVSKVGDHWKTVKTCKKQWQIVKNSSIDQIDLLFAKDVAMAKSKKKLHGRTKKLTDLSARVKQYMMHNATEKRLQNSLYLIAYSENVFTEIKPAVLSEAWQIDS